MKIHRHLISLVLALVLCCGCGIQSKNNDEAQATEEYKRLHAVTQIKENQKNIYLVLKSWGNSYWDSVLQGAIDAGNDYGCNVYAGGVMKEDDWQTQEKLIEEAAASGADTLILAPVNAQPISEEITRLYKSGMKIIFVDTIIDTTDFEVCYMTDNINAGETAAKEMLDRLREQGKSEAEPLSIGIQAGSTNSQTIIDRVAGFMNYWTVNAPQSWRVLDDVKINNGDLELAEKYGGELINNHKDLAGIYACNNGSTVGSVKSITASGRDDIVLVGFDLSQEMEDMIRSNKYPVSTIVQRQYSMGYSGVKMAAGCAEEDFKFVDTGITLVRSDNINDSDIIKELENN